MGRRKKKIDYRQLYKDYYNIEFGREMVVHHIDFDRSNNNINNLLLMPNWLHAKYHTAYKMLFGLKFDDSLAKELELTDPNISIHYCQLLRNMADALDSIKPWLILKMEMDKMIHFNMVYRYKQTITEESAR